MSGGSGQAKSREEVMNVLLAECINDSGMLAEAENIEQGIGRTRAMPDVIVSFQGLRCSIEGKWADVAQARTVVSAQAKDRIKSGIAHLALAVVYPTALRSVTLSKKKQALLDAALDHCVFTEQADGDWRSGDVAAILDDLRRSQEMLATDDVVTAAVSDLQEGMFGLVQVLKMYPAACDRLAEILCVYEPSDEVGDSNAE